MRKGIMFTVGSFAAAAAVLTGCYSNQGFETIPSQFKIQAAEEGTGDRGVVAEKNRYGVIEVDGRDDLRLYDMSGVERMFADEGDNGGIFKDETREGTTFYQGGVAVYLLEEDETTGRGELYEMQNGEKGSKIADYSEFEPAFGDGTREFKKNGQTVATLAQSKWDGTWKVTIQKPGIVPTEVVILAIG